MVGKNSVALLATVSLIIVLLTVLCALLYGEFVGQKTYEGTFAAAGEGAGYNIIYTEKTEKLVETEGIDSEWIYI